MKDTDTTTDRFDLDPTAVELTEVERRSATRIGKRVPLSPLKAALSDIIANPTEHSKNEIAFYRFAIQVCECDERQAASAAREERKRKKTRKEP